MQKHPMMQIIYEDNVAAWPRISMNHSYSTTEMYFPSTNQREAWSNPYCQLWMFGSWFIHCGSAYRGQWGGGLWGVQGGSRGKRIPEAAFLMTITFSKLTISPCNLFQEVPLIKCHLFLNLPFYWHKFTMATHCSSLSRRMLNSKSLQHSMLSHWGRSIRKTQRTT